MTRATTTNVLLVGIILGMAISQACGGGAGGGTANAADDCTCTIEGPITIDASASQPLPVMICDGQDTEGTCARVYESVGGDNGLKTF